MKRVVFERWLLLFADCRQQLVRAPCLNRALAQVQKRPGVPLFAVVRLDAEPQERWELHRVA